jgi:hypothetical protein
MELDTTDDFDADLEAGFNATPTETPVRNEDQQEPEADTTGVQADAPAETRETSALSITKSQFDELMAKAAEIDQIKAEQARATDKVFGKLGGLERALQEIRGSGTGPVTVTEDDFAEMKEVFPELAASSAAALNRVLARAKGGSGAAPDPEAIKQFVEEGLAPTRKDLIYSRLDEVIEDWQDEIKKPEFVAWRNAQPDNVKALWDSPSVRDAAKMLRMYRDRETTSKTTSNPDSKTTRQRQIEAAVQPKGITGMPAAKSDEDDFEAGFREAIGR